MSRVKFVSPVTLQHCGWTQRNGRVSADAAPADLPGWFFTQLWRSHADKDGMSEIQTSPTMNAIVGNDPSLRLVLARAVRVAPTRIPVLVTGESGTGKELLARVLHELGPQPKGPFVAVNCGTLARELAESQLFGHERGAFTGAGSRRPGWFEEAAGGTLVLDEIGELPMDLQPKLLRALETGRIRRVGGSGETAVEVRVLATTLRDLRRDTQRGSFRLDLFHRLAGFELKLPALRDRPGDVLRLAQHFLDEFKPDLGSRAITADAASKLLAHDWPGNVRELRHVIRRAVLLTSEVIDAPSVEIETTGGSAAGMSRAADGSGLMAAAVDFGRSPAGPSLDSDLLPLRNKSFEQIQTDVFVWALRRNGNSRRRAAAALGISRSTFCDRVRRLGLAPGAAPASP
jgi:two-component system nitrogen regulation response regulator GlnG